MALLVTGPSGRTFALDVPDDGLVVREVLRLVEEREAVPATALHLRGPRGAPWADDGVVLAASATGMLLEARLAGGLAGGKGGFGAMLRALAKQNTGHKTTDFGACRDLNGRRLRHVNDEIKLQKWAEARKRKEEAKERGETWGSDEEAEVLGSSSGIAGWHLGVPSWIEHVKNRETKGMRRKAAAKRRWEDEEQQVAESGLATREFVGTVTMVDGVRHAFCVVDSDVYVPFTANTSGEDWTETLKVGDRLQVTAVLKPQRKNHWYGYRAARHLDDGVSSGGGSGQVEGEEERSAMEAAVLEGFHQSAEIKKQARKDRQDEVRQLLPVDLEGKMKGLRWGAEAGSWLGLLAGEVDFKSGGRVRGVADFSSFCALGVALTSGKWYYEVEVVTAGVMQVGWADHEFKGDSSNGDGVGDDKHSWAFDGCRQQKWNGDGSDYGLSWKEGDVVGCLLDVDAQTISFTLNGEPMPTAFDSLDDATPSPRPKVGGKRKASAAEAEHKESSAGEGPGAGFFPATSVEDGEVARFRVTAAGMRFGPPPGFKPVGEAMAAPPEDEAAVTATRAPFSSAVACATAADTKAEKEEETCTTEAPAAKRTKVAAEPPTALAPAPAKKPTNEPRPPVEPEALDLAPFASEADLEALGLDRLKAALLFLGVKCGGTLQERAARLFSLKGVAKADIDPKLLASKAGGKRKRKG